MQEPTSLFNGRGGRFRVLIPAMSLVSVLGLAVFLAAGHGVDRVRAQAASPTPAPAISTISNSAAYYFALIAGSVNPDANALVLNGLQVAQLPTGTKGYCIDTSGAGKAATLTPSGTMLTCPYDMLLYVTGPLAATATSGGAALTVYCVDQAGNLSPAPRSPDKQAIVCAGAVIATSGPRTVSATTSTTTTTTAASAGASATGSTSAPSTSGGSASTSTSSATPTPSTAGGGASSATGASGTTRTGGSVSPTGGTSTSAAPPY